MCLVCGNKKNNLGSFLPKYLLCSKCKTIFIDKKVTASYKESYFQEKEAPSIITLLTNQVLSSFIDSKINKILDTAENESPKILDYGCGSGKLVDILLKSGVDINGFEPSKGALKIAEKKKLPIYNKLKKVKGDYNLIMLWHSLEHIDNPLTILKKLKANLRKNGRLLIAVPNADSFDAKLTKQKWFHYTYPLHRIHFTYDSLKFLLYKSGFKIREIDFFNPEYTLTGLIQSLLNLFLPQDVLYSVVTNRRLSMNKNRATFYALLSIFLIIFFFPVIFLIYFLELIFKKTDAMVVIAEKN